MFEWDQLVVDVCVTTLGQRASMLVEEALARKVNLTRDKPNGRERRRFIWM